MNAWRFVIALPLIGLYACREPDAARIGVAVSAGMDSAVGLAAAAHCPQGAASIAIRHGGSLSTTLPSVVIADSFARDPTIRVVVGHSNSASSIAGAQIYERAGLPQIAPTTTAVSYSLIGGNMFRLVPDDRTQGSFLARTIALDTGRLAIVYVNDEYGRGLVSEIERAATPIHATISYSENVDSDNVADLIAQIIAARPSRLLWLGRRYPLVEVFPRVREAMPSMTAIASDGADPSGMTPEQLHPLIGLRFIRLVDPDAQGRQIDAVRRDMNAAGVEVGLESLLVYDAVAIACTALKSKDHSRAGIRAYLVDLGRGAPAYAGATGPIAFDASRNLPRDPSLGIVTTQGVRTLPATGSVQ